MKDFFEDILFLLKNSFSNKEKIKGKCKACGECCKTIVFYVGKNLIKTEQQFESLKEFDKRYNNFEINGKSPDGALYFKCKLLGKDNKCKVYPFRSIACRMYPKYKASFFTRGNGLKENCGYYIKPDKEFKDFL